MVVYYWVIIRGLIPYVLLSGLESDLEDCSNARESEYLDRRKEVANEGNKYGEEAADDCQDCGNELAEARTESRENGAENRKVVVDEDNEPSENIDDELKIVNY